MTVFKKSGLVAVAIFALASMSAQAAKYGTAGCGLGSLVFNDQPGKIQIVSATLNGTGYQTFGITTGTSNCTEGDSRDQASLYITVNQEALAKDISRGSGETLAGLSKLLQCSDEAALGTTLQRNYQKLFPADQKASLSESIEKTIRTEGTVSCGLYS